MMKALLYFLKSRAAYRVLVIVIVGLVLVNIGIAIRFINRLHRVGANIEKIDKETAPLNRISQEMESLNRRLDQLISDLDKSVSDLGNIHLPLPTNGVTSSYHAIVNGKKNYEESLIQDIDKDQGLVLVTTMDSKMSIIFRPAPENLGSFHKGWIAPVTFDCVRKEKDSCDFIKPYKAFISNGPVKVVKITGGK